MTDDPFNKERDVGYLDAMTRLVNRAVRVMSAQPGWERASVEARRAFRANLAQHVQVSEEGAVRTLTLNLSQGPMLQEREVIT